MLSIPFVKHDCIMKKLTTNLKTALITTCLLSIFTPLAQAETQASSLSYNLSLTSDYRYRGISQTRLDPALQGGLDYADNQAGWYLGAWGSSIKWIKDTPGAGSTPLEIDVYGGKKFQINEKVSYDLGVLAYYYANNRLDQIGNKNANTLEFYGQINYGPAYLKYSQAVTPLFGINDSRNSYYLDLGSNIELGSGYTLNLHAGYQKVKGLNDSAASYQDYKVGVSKTLTEAGDWSLALAAHKTTADRNFYASPANGKFMGKNALVLSLTKTF